MRADKKYKREDEIAQAAYEILADKGLAGLSMLAVAKRAKASNETLYRWYGDKIGLFRMLIERNAERVAAALNNSCDQGADPRETLAKVGPDLLAMLMSPQAIALNRAAAADASNALGQVLAQAGRGSVMPLIIRLFHQLEADQAILASAETAANLWIDLLVGDWQTRCVTGAMPPPSPDAIYDRATRAQELLFRLYGAEQH